MKIKKRSGHLVDANWHKLTEHVKDLANVEPKLTFVDPSIVTQKTISGLYDGVTTVQINELLAENAAMLSTKHYEYSYLASRILVANLHKNTPKTFAECVDLLYTNKDNKTGEAAPLVSYDLLLATELLKDTIAEVLDPKLDYERDYFGLKTLYKSYLLKSNGNIIETPQYMYMRVSIGIHGEDIENVKKTYLRLAQGYYTHATPTLFNSGTPKPQMSSCFLLTNKGDSLEGIMDTMKDVATISAASGGIGLAIHDVRASGSYIKGSGGTSKGLIPLLKTYNELARYWDQGGNKRKGSFAMYLEPWHADVFELLDIRKNTGKEELRARELFPALWIPDLFMQRVEADQNWTLMCPNECPGLSDVYGDEFKLLYERYEAENKGRKTIKAQELWTKILDSQIETGTPYMLYKDAANSKSNQKNLGTIKSSNLCTEILEYTSPTEQAVCNLASIAVNKCLVKEYGGKLVGGGKSEFLGYFFDHDLLYNLSYELTINLNRVIDGNHYPTPETKLSNLKHRPIGIGIQGLADAFAMMNFAFDSEEAKGLNNRIFETIYFASLTASKDLAIHNGPYESFEGSPASIGILQFDMWNKTEEVEKSSKWDWKTLRDEIAKHGIRNSLLLAPMPTASTASILGNNECFEPYTSNLYTRRVLSGEFIMVNRHLVDKLVSLDLWNDTIINKLKNENGSIQNIPEIPTEVKEVFKTVWEISQKKILEMAADRGKFICQSQSMNVFMENANFGKLTSMHFYGWKLGLKTGMYYLRTKAATDAIKFTAEKEEIQEQISCSIDNPDDCEMCGA